jgi:hypothetical protein
MPLRLLILLAALLLGSAQSMAQERTWILDQTDQEVYLVFGVPETDDVGVSFWCTLRSGVVKFYLPESDPDFKLADPVDFELDIDAKKFPLKGKTSVNEEAGTLSLEAEFKATDPVFAALETANRFTIKAGSSNHVFPLGEADFPAFLEACGKP